MLKNSRFVKIIMTFFLSYSIHGIALKYIEEKLNEIFTQQCMYSNENVIFFMYNCDKRILKSNKITEPQNCCHLPTSRLLRHLLHDKMSTISTKMLNILA